MFIFLFKAANRRRFSAAVCSLFQFPKLDLTGLFVKSQIAVIASGLNVPRRQRRCHGAAGFFPVGAVMELTAADV